MAVKGWTQREGAWYCDEHGWKWCKLCPTNGTAGNGTAGRDGLVRASAASGALGAKTLTDDGAALAGTGWTQREGAWYCNEHGWKWCKLCTKKTPSQASMAGQLAKDGAILAGVAALSFLWWAAPMIILGGLGLLMFNAGTTETVGLFGQTTTETSFVGYLGMAFVVWAFAVFFGRNTLMTIVAGWQGLTRDDGKRSYWHVYQGTKGFLLSLLCTIGGVVIVIVGLGS